ncbi:MAG: hypothetical protein WAW10_02745 [Gallionella sp.]
MPPIVPIEIRAYPINRVPTQARAVLNEKLTAAIRQRGTYPVLLDSSMPYLGRCTWRNDAPDGELHMRPINSEPAGNHFMRYVYLHELSHRLMWDVDQDLRGHYWMFAAMLATLLRRTVQMYAGVAGSSLGGVNSLTMYDVSEEPEEHRGWALQRALDVSAELAPLPISAEECAERIWRIWFDENRRRS